MHDLADFGLRDMAELGPRLRKAGDGATTMQGAAQRIVEELRSSLRQGPGGPPACPLVRFYKTHPVGELPKGLQTFAQGAAQKELHPETRCLTLLATAGERAEWNDTRKSRGHQAIPLTSEEMVAQAPMISSLIQQLGLPVSTVLRPDAELMLDLAQRSYNVFHVPEASGSPHIPAQEDFVRPYAIRSALGFGGMLPSGNLFAIILFSRVRIGPESAALFRSQALGVKLAILPFEPRRVFVEDAA